jgi:hypothetical protein
MHENEIYPMRKGVPLENPDAVEKLGLQLIRDSLETEHPAEAASLSDVIHTLAAEVEKLREENNRLNYRFNRMYVVMTAVWERLRCRKGTWEEKLDRVRSWAKEPERELAKRILTAAGIEEEPTGTASTEEVEDNQMEY